MEAYDIFMLIRLQIACFVFSLIIAIPFFAIKRAVSYANKMFSYVLAFQFIFLIADIINIITLSNASAVHPVVSKLVYIVYVAAISVLICMTFLYMRSLLKDDQRKWLMMVLSIPVLAGVVIAAVIPWEYAETAWGNHNSGNAVYSVFFIVSVYTLLTLISAIRNRAGLDADKIRLFSITLFLYIFMTLLRFFAPALQMTSLGTTVLIIAIYLTMENPDRILRGMYLKEKVNAEEAAKKIEEFAYIDILTGIMNRRQFMELATAQVERTKRQNGTAYLIIFDIDYFKKVNDTYGHLVGDKVLKSVTERINEVIRPYDLFGRFGGEEFTVFVSDISKTDIENYAERLRLSINSAPMVFPEATLTVSASFGIASVTRANNLDGVIHFADEALYKAKSEGRNRVVMA